jgi:hypothetical protein
MDPLRPFPCRNASGKHRAPSSACNGAYSVFSSIFLRAGAGFRPLGNRDAQHAVPEARLRLLRVDALGKLHRALEEAVAPFAVVLVFLLLLVSCFFSPLSVTTLSARVTSTSFPGGRCCRSGRSSKLQRHSGKNWERREAGIPNFKRANHP